MPPIRIGGCFRLRLTWKRVHTEEEGANSSGVSVLITITDLLRRLTGICQSRLNLNFGNESSMNRTSFGDFQEPVSLFFG